MSQYDNNMTAVLFQNTERKSDKHPQWKGHVEIDGRKYWVSGWERMTKRGDAISLKIEEAKPASMAYADNTDTRKQQKKAESDFHNDDIPF